MAKRGNPNPKGNKPDKILRDALMIALNRVDKDHDTGIKTKRLHRIADKLSLKAADGDIPAIKEVWDRVEGKATQPIGGVADAPLVFEQIVRKIIDPRPDN